MKTGIIIGNLGTPRAPEARAVGEYLREFLMDPYVIDKPFLFRWLLVNLIIVPFRKKKSAHAYKTIWAKSGSPLMIFSEQLRDLLQSLSPQTPVALGMNYGRPSLVEAFQKMQDCDSIIMAALYPQYALSSYETWKMKALRVAAELKVKSQLIWLLPFYDAEEYISSEVRVIEKTLAGRQVGRDLDHILFSYHGLPERHITKLDSTGSHCFQKENCCAQMTPANKNCYRAQSYQTTRLIAAKMGLKKEHYSVSFQSRLGREPWIQPFTDKVITELPQQGVKRLVVVVPSFVADCLETLEEINMRAREEFINAGGEEFVFVPCLNAEPFWGEQLLKLIKKQGVHQ